MTNIFKKIKNNPEKIVFGLEKLNLLCWMSDKTYIKLVYKLAFGRKLDLENPKSFTEKINWYKLYYRNSLMKQCADKYNVREYVKKKIGDKHLNKVYGIWNKFDDIDFSKLPNKFVLKPTNGSGDIVICNDKSNFKIGEAKKILLKNRNHHFSSKTKEWAYYNLQFRIIAEELIESSDKYQVKDYKFFCFNGEPKFLFVASERGTEHLKFDFFDMNWNWLPVTNGHEHNPNILKPKHFNEMVEISRKLSHDFPHVRVDLYEENDKIIFGELTFYHFGGFTRFEPDEWDFNFGEYFDINNIKNEVK